MFQNSEEPKIRHGLNAIKSADRDFEMIMKIASDAYSDGLDNEVVARFLKPIGYKTRDDFRKEGHDNLGKDQHAKVMDEINKFNLGVELIVFGYNENESPRLFEVRHPGRHAELT